MQVACLASAEKGQTWPLQHCRGVDGCGDAHGVVAAASRPALGCYSMAQAKERAPAALLVVITVLTVYTASLEALA